VLLFITSEIVLFHTYEVQVVDCLTRVEQLTGAEVAAYHKPAPDSQSDSSGPGDCFSDSEILSSFNWAYSYGNVPDQLQPPKGSYDKRQNSLLQSFRNRFPQHAAKFATKKDQHHLVSSLRRKYDIRLDDYCGQCHLVTCRDDSHNLLEFCEHEKVLAVDTESAYCSQRIHLLQISNGDTAFLCFVQKIEMQFLIDIARTICCNSEKTLLHFGGNVVHRLLSVLKIPVPVVCISLLFDVQKCLHNSRGRAPSLAAIVKQTYDRVLSRVWKISGWDNFPLEPEQISFAALDVLMLFRIGNILIPK
jgi:hypothetical protein